MGSPALPGAAFERRHVPFLGVPLAAPLIASSLRFVIETVSAAAVPRVSHAVVGVKAG